MKGVDTILLVIACALIGSALGLRFRVFILVPAILAGATTVIAVGVAYDAGTFSIVLGSAVLATSLEMGYLASVMRFVAFRLRSPLDVTD
jgi:hypothetical protein